MITRPSNANKHPGDIQRLSGARRPKEVVAAERTAKAAVKEKAAAAKESAIQKVARIENDARKKHTSSRLASHVADKLTIPRVARARKTIDEQELNGIVPKFGVKATSCNKEDEGLPDEQSDDDEAKRSDGCGPSDRGDRTPDEESESSDERDMDQDEEIEGTSSTRKKSRKKQKKGIAVRARIDTVSAEMLREDEPNVEVMKRKAGVNAGSTDAETVKPCKKKLKTPANSSQEELSGVVSGWKKNKTPQGNFSRAPSSASTRTTVSRGASTTIPMDNDDSTSDGPAFAYGGIPSDEEDLERPGQEDNSALSNRYRSVAKIEEIHTVPPRLKYGQVKNTNENAVRLRIKNSNLPLGTTERFTKNVLPIALDTVGALAPWEFPDEQQMIDAWNLVFGSRNDHPIADGDVNSDLFTAAKGLIKRGISTWLHKFAVTAEKALLTEFKRQGIVSIEEKAVFVQYLLGDADNMSSKYRPFLWSSAYEGHKDDSEKVQFQGIFQGRLVARTFLEHILATSTIGEDKRVLERPVGALVMSIQAVHRALLYSVEGIFKTPGFKTGAFSKANWGDYSTQSAHGETTIKRASVFLKRITTLKDQQWDDIYKAALATQEHSKPGDVGEHGRSGDDGSTGEESSEDDSELFDPLYDGSPSPSCSGQVSEEV